MFKTRIEWVDRWRGILISLIVLFHVLGAFVGCTDETNALRIQRVKDFLGTFQTVSFFAVMGFLPFGSDENFLHFCKKKSFRLLVPYVFWACAMGGVILSVTAIKGGLSVGAVHVEGCPSIQILKAIVSTGIYPKGLGPKVIGSLWFLPCMFSVCMADYWLRRCFAFKGGAFVELLALIAGIILLWRANIWSAPFFVTSVPGYMLYVVLARALMKCVSWDDESSRMKMYCMFGSLALYLALAIMLKVRSENFLLASIYDLMRGCIGGLGTFLLARSFSWHVLAIVGKNSMVILVLHKFVIMLFQVSLKSVVNGPVLAVVLIMLLLMGLSIAIPMCVAPILRRYVPWCIGEDPRRSG